MKAHRGALVVALWTLAPGMAAQVTVHTQFSFDQTASPWASTGPVAFTGLAGLPALGTGDKPATTSNVAAAQVGGGVYAVGTTFANSFANDYGVELWLKAPALAGSSSSVVIASIGDPTFNATTGSGVSLVWTQNGAGSGYEVRYNNAPNPGDGAGVGHPNVAGGWVHVALVKRSSYEVGMAADGNVALFINGTLAASREGSYVAPSANWHLFTNADRNTTFSGMVDDVRIFSFAAGSFDPATHLSYAGSAIPEPSTYAALLGLAALGYYGYRKRRRRH